MSNAGTCILNISAYRTMNQHISVHLKGTQLQVTCYRDTKQTKMLNHFNFQPCILVTLLVTVGLDRSNWREEPFILAHVFRKHNLSWQSRHGGVVWCRAERLGQKQRCGHHFQGSFLMTVISQQVHISKDSITSQLMSHTRDQVFSHMSMWKTYQLQGIIPWSSRRTYFVVIWNWSLIVWFQDFISLTKRTHEQVLVKLEQCGWIGDRETKMEIGDMKRLRGRVHKHMSQSGVEDDIIN